MLPPSIHSNNISGRFLPSTVKNSHQTEILIVAMINTKYGSPKIQSAVYVQTNVVQRVFASIQKIWVVKVTALIMCCILIATTAPSKVVAEEKAEEKSALAEINKVLVEVYFFDLGFGQISVDAQDRDGNPIVNIEGEQQKTKVTIPLLIVWLAFGAFFFTFFFRFINFRAFFHAINIVRGKYDKDDHTGEISHFRALTSALSATVGLGNIGSVAIAIQTGGPGAVFWMVFVAFFGMTSKFVSCTLAQLYRKVNSDGSISGGPMYYLDLGLREKGKVWGILGKFLGVAFALMIMGGAIGGGNMFQANQTAEVITHVIDLQDEGTIWNARLVIGLILATAVAIVILGGIKRIAVVTSRVVPLMCGMYMLAGWYIIITNFSQLPETVALIFRMAFTDNAVYGGIIGVMVKGIQRGGFSNEAGLGSAAIVHAAAKTDEPVREGMVAMLGPFIDTVLVCSTTALVVIITGTWNDPAIVAQGGNVGVSITSAAFGSTISWFPYVLTVSIVLFAYSTMISWCYYGERGWIYLLDHFGKERGLKTVAVFRFVFIAAIVWGAVEKLQHVLDFADMMILSVALPNILGGIILAPVVKKRLDDYSQKYWKK